MSVRFKTALYDDRLSYWFENILRSYSKHKYANFSDKPSFAKYGGPIKNAVFIMFEKKTKDEIKKSGDRKIAIVVNKISSKRAKQNRVILDDDMSISFPGGFIERNESPLEAAKREFGEEFFKTKDNVFTSQKFKFITCFKYISSKIFVGEYDFSIKHEYTRTHSFDNEIVSSSLISVKHIIEIICTGLLSKSYDFRSIKSEGKNIRMRACAKISMQDILGKSLIDAANGLNMLNKLALWDYRLLRIRHKMKKSQWNLMVKKSTKKTIGETQFFYSP